MQVMLAQQESIAELLSLYEADHSAWEQQQGRQAAAHDQHLDDAQQQHFLGKASLKKDRCGFC